MSNREEIWTDPSVRAKETLDALIDSEQVSDTHAPDVLSTSESFESDCIPVTEALQESPIITGSDSRERIRMLLITRDASILTPGSPGQNRLTDLRDHFLEIHAIVLNEVSRTEEERQALRLYENIWVYPTNAPTPWKLPLLGYRVAERQLVFAGSFRADVIVAEDGFESGILGYILSRKYERPFQLHLYEEFFDQETVELKQYPTLYTLAHEYLLRRVQSVRVASEHVRQAVIEECPELEADTELLPTYYDLTQWREAIPALDLHAMYPRFKFIVLHVSSMHASSHTDTVIAGVARVLRRYGTVGLVIVGNGPLRHTLERQAIALGVEKQVEFLPMTPDVISYMKTAHAYVHLSEDGSEDMYCIEAAVARLPIVGGKEGIAGTLFSDGDSACLCSVSDVSCVGKSINHFLNENQERTRFGRSAYDTVFARVRQDYHGYLAAFRDSVERAMRV